jgi:hypothetical protein
VRIYAKVPTGAAMSVRDGLRDSSALCAILRKSPDAAGRGVGARSISSTSQQSRPAGARDSGVAARAVDTGGEFGGSARDEEGCGDEKTPSRVGRMGH